MKIFLALLFTLSPLAAWEIPASSTQAIVGVAPSWDSSKVTLSFYQHGPSGWQKVGGEIQGRLGKSGLAWGLGLHPLPANAKLKKEGDSRAPAGVFSIGGAWGYAQDIQRHPRLPYRQITSRDLWVEDPKSPSYNRHLILPHEPATAWEKKQQMRQGDHAHSLKVFIAHNVHPQPRPGLGSSIFFHIWRGGGSKPTAGCTTISEPALKSLTAWLDPTRNPVYILLPAAEYQKYRAPWKLP